MRYLIGTQAQINTINQAEAQARGCEGTTTQWYATRLTDNGQTCLMIDDDKALPGSTDSEPAWPVEAED